MNVRDLEQGEIPISAPQVLKDSDPRLLQPSIAAVPKPPKAELVALHKSRFMSD